jgi:hypothetical protein
MLLQERATLSSCCKVTVIFLALYALWRVMFCLNDCFSAKNDGLFFGRYLVQGVSLDS